MGYNLALLELTLLWTSAITKWKESSITLEFTTGYNFAFTIVWEAEASRSRLGGRVREEGISGQRIFCPSRTWGFDRVREEG